MNQTQSRYARQYAREFKENAVLLVVSGREVHQRTGPAYTYQMPLLSKNLSSMDCGI